VAIKTPEHNASDDAEVLRLRRRHLVLVLLVMPFMLAFYGFFSRQKVSPDFPSVPVEVRERGRIFSRDGTIFAEGPAEQRKYPQGTLGAHVVGFSGKLQKDGSYGLEGLELTKDKLLQSPGDIVITIDPNIQAIVQEELKKTVVNFAAANGSVVILETKTGRILAAASYPEFDPNSFSTVGNPEALSNSAFLKQYEPGSVMKPFVVASLLQSGKLNLSTMIDTPMALRVGEKTYKDVAEHATQLNAWDILRYSSNSGMINMSISNFTDKELHGWLEHIGFGSTMKTPSVYTQSGSLRMTPWVPQDQASITIGQSVSTTTLQLAALYNIFANDGVYLTPYIIEGDTLVEPRRVFSNEVGTTMKQMLQYVVQQGHLNDIMPPELNVAGKTGTADIYDNRQGKYIRDGTLSFAGFFPADRPTITMVVSVQKATVATMSTYVAAPLFASIAKNMASLLQPDGTLLVTPQPLGTNTSTPSTQLPSTEAQSTQATDLLESTRGE
jgi:cell division protein FtsI (penicillin-binding protein 3)